MSIELLHAHRAADVRLRSGQVLAERVTDPRRHEIQHLDTDAVPDSPSRGKCHFERQRVPSARSRRRGDVAEHILPRWLRSAL